MGNGNFYKDNADLAFYVDKWIDWAPLVELTEYLYRTEDGFKSADEALEFYRDILDMVGSFVADEVAPKAAKLDLQHPEVKDGVAVDGPEMTAIMEKIKALELHGMCVPRELGGMNCPLLTYMVCVELFARADVSVCAHHGFHGGMAMAMLIYSINEGTTTFDAEAAKITGTRWEKEIAEIARGEAWGSMDITEPDAGSDMAALRTKGEQDEDGNWFVTGQKIFITSGHGKYHFVIARTEPASSEDDPFAGLKGMSMFLVPAYEEAADGSIKRLATVDRVEDKLGHNCSATCTVSFDRTPAQLIGERGEGFKHMLTLMNNARVGVGFESLGLMEAAMRLAKAYAEERRSMGKTIDRHEMIADYFDEMETDIVGIRAMAMHGCYHEEMAQKQAILIKYIHDSGEDLGRKRAEKAKRRHAAKSRRATPLLKYLAAEKAVEIARMGVQIHGGVGYTKEYGAEKLLRDAMVMPIYEGTSQIQALMAMKDTLMGIIKNPQGFVRRTAQARWRSMSARDPLERKLAKVQSMSLSAQQHLITRTATAKIKDLRGTPLASWSKALSTGWDPKRDFAFAMLHAERLTRILCDELIGELLWEQAQRFPERREWLERHLERAEPRCKANLERITGSGDRILRKLGRLGDEAERVAS